ncbi:FMN-binding protein [Traorella massiliensis]|uniref:FMN-binding protein n=1 Tax=Traorella massiliensis TaxID=1903263 RepID=UPI0008F8E5DF|nr:FMN-binding protein [Traorella massiliensis]
MKKLFSLLTAGTLVLALGACSTTKEPVVEEFSAEYEMKGTTSAGLPKNDTFIFEGETTDGIITKLNFDIIRNKGMEDEYSKKDLYGYEMNVSDGAIEEVNGALNLTNLSASGFVKYPGTDSGVQFMVRASLEGLTPESTFADLVVFDLSTQSTMELENAIAAYSYLAAESGVEELTGDTLVIDLMGAFDELVVDGAFVAGEQRVSYAGYNGGRSYGEQIDAIVDYILANDMTLEDVYEMFRTVNQQSTPIEERDVISGATIAFVGDFQRTVYLAIHGELFEGVTNATEADGSTTVEVVTQGYGGEIETHVTFDADNTITAISVRDDQESEGVGAVLTADGSDFLNSLIEGQSDIESVEVSSGATVTSEALKKAVQMAIDYMNEK